MIFADITSKPSFVRAKGGFFECTLTVQRERSGRAAPKSDARTWRVYSEALQTR